MPKGVYVRSSSEKRRARELILTVGAKTRFQKGHPGQTGTLNKNWKGDAVGYNALHQWVRRHVPIPKRCQQCKRVRKLQSANVSGQYRRAAKHWKYLCARCHVVMDGTINNLKR